MYFKTASDQKNFGRFNKKYLQQYSFKNLWSKLRSSLVKRLNNHNKNKHFSIQTVLKSLETLAGRYTLLVKTLTFLSLKHLYVQTCSINLTGLPFTVKQTHCLWKLVWKLFLQCLHNTREIVPVKTKTTIFNVCLMHF